MVQPESIGTKLERQACEIDRALRGLDTFLMSDIADEFETPRIANLVRRRGILLGLLLLVVLLSAWGTWRGVEAAMRHRLLGLAYAEPPAGMVFVPPGEFQKGSDDPQADTNERPVRRVFLPGFYLDRTEVTNAAFQRFDPTHTFAPGKENFPVVKCAKAEAERYAAWAGKRLPTGDEWEKAARGTDARLYPWGNQFDRAKANLAGADGLLPVGSFPEGASPYGALDMSGNVWEWVSDTYHDGSGFGLARYERGIIRGGAYSYSPLQGRASHIGFESENLTCGDLGFRCAKDAMPLK